jgi:hypothetical protein
MGLHLYQQFRVFDQRNLHYPLHQPGKDGITLFGLPLHTIAYFLSNFQNSGFKNRYTTL